MKIPAGLSEQDAIRYIFAELTPTQEQEIATTVLAEGRDLAGEAKDVLNNAHFYRNIDKSLQSAEQVRNISNICDEITQLISEAELSGELLKICRNVYYVAHKVHCARVEYHKNSPSIEMVEVTVYGLHHMDCWLRWRDLCLEAIKRNEET